MFIEIAYVLRVAVARHAQAASRRVPATTVIRTAGGARHSGTLACASRSLARQDHARCAFLLAGLFVRFRREHADWHGSSMPHAGVPCGRREFTLAFASIACSHLFKRSFTHLFISSRRFFPTGVWINQQGAFHRIDS